MSNRPEGRITDRKLQVWPEHFTYCLVRGCIVKRDTIFIHLGIEHISSFVDPVFDILPIRSRVYDKQTHTANADIRNTRACVFNGRTKSSGAVYISAHVISPRACGIIINSPAFPIAVLLFRFKLFPIKAQFHLRVPSSHPFGTPCPIIIEPCKFYGCPFRQIEIMAYSIHISWIDLSAVIATSYSIVKVPLNCIMNVCFKRLISNITIIFRGLSQGRYS